MHTKASFEKLWSSMRTESDKDQIVIVDDDPQIAELVMHWLSGRGYHCYHAANAEKALEILASHPIALVLSDIMMPGKNGMQLLEEIHATYPTVAVVLISALDDRQTAAHAIKTGASGYLIKPIKHNDVIINVASALERRRLLMMSKWYEEFLEAEVRERTAAMRRSEEEIVLRLAGAMQFRDVETGDHVRRIGLFSAEMARALGWQTKLIDQIHLASLMHDIGKIGVPDQILLKPGKLTDEEFDVMKTHTVVGAKLLGGSDIPILKMAADIARSHHERWDGRGYPDGLARKVIPESARIVAIVDVYDALASARPYKPAWPEDKILATLRSERGKHLDPNLIEIFLDIFPIIRRLRHEVDEGIRESTFPSQEEDHTPHIDLHLRHQRPANVG